MRPSPKWLKISVLTWLLSVHWARQARQKPDAGNTAERVISALDVDVVVVNSEYES